MQDFTVSRIYVYPIKSLGGIAIEKAMVEERGLQYDRRWMLVDEKGKFLTQREHPQMATLQISFAENGLKVSAKSGETLMIPFAEKTTGEEMKVSVWTSKLTAEIYENEVNQWFSDVLKMNARLVRMNENSKRIVSPYYAVRKYQDEVSFADGYPLLIIGESSLADLNSKLEREVGMDRFRPNIVFKDGEPFAEDKWKKIRLGETIFHVVKPCARCVMTTINQETGEIEGKEPLKTLSTYRLSKRGGKTKVNFGQNMIAENFGKTVSIGDKIEIIESRWR